MGDNDVTTKAWLLVKVMMMWRQDPDDRSMINWLFKIVAEGLW